MGIIERLERRKKIRSILTPIFILTSISFYIFVKIKGFSTIEPFIIPIVLFFWILIVVILNLFNISLSPFKGQASPGKLFDEVESEKDTLTEEFIDIVGKAIRKEKKFRDSNKNGN